MLGNVSYLVGKENGVMYVFNFCGSREPMHENFVTFKIS